MPSRVIRGEIRRSHSLSNVSMEAELTFDRLILAADDYGRLDGRPVCLKADLFPVRESATPDAICSWVAELERDGCVLRYVVDGRPYLQLTGWERHRGKGRRASESRYPDPSDAQSVDGSESTYEQGGHGKASENTTPSNPRISMQSEDRHADPPVVRSTRDEGRGTRDGGRSGAGAPTPTPRARPSKPTAEWVTDPPPEVDPRHLALADQHREPQVRLRPNDRALSEPGWGVTRVRWAEDYARLDAAKGADVVDGALARYRTRQHWQREVPTPGEWRHRDRIEKAHAEHVTRGSRAETGGDAPPPERARCRCPEEVEFRVHVSHELTEREGARELELLERAGVRRSEQGQAYADDLRAGWEREQEPADPPPPRIRPRAQPRPRPVLVVEGRDRPAIRDVEDEDRRAEVDTEQRRRELRDQAERVARGEA